MNIFELCMDQGQSTFRAVNQELHGFVAEVGGWANLPKKFTLNVPAMNELEQGIDDASAKGDLQTTEILCGQYRARFTAYLNGWRKRTEKAKGAVQC